MKHVFAVYRKKKDDLFNVRATIDLECKGWTDNDAINKLIYDEIQDNRKLGEVTVSPEEFIFTPFEGTLFLRSL